MPQSRKKSWMGDSASASVNNAAESVDEKRWKREQRSKAKDQAEARRRKAAKQNRMVMTIAPSVRCERCEHWSPPVNPEADPFGQCNETYVVMERLKGTEYERGHIVGQDELDQLAEAWLFPTAQPLRTQSFFSCSRFSATAYDPDTELTDEERNREWEELRRCA